MKFYHDIKQRLRRLISQPAEHATRWHKAARFAWDLSRYCTRQLYEDRASEIAAALTYRTIFSLVPCFVLALIVFQAFGGFETWGEQFKERVYDYLGITAVTVQADNGQDAEEEGAIPTQHLEEASDAAARGELTAEQATLLERAAEDESTADEGGLDLSEAQQTARDEAIAKAEEAASTGELTPEQALLLDRAVERGAVDLSSDQAGEVERALAAANDDEELLLRLDQIFDDLNNQVAQVSFGGIGVAGVLLLIWAALGLAVQLEDSFNQVYRASTSRAWHLRIAVYWSLITLGPVLLAMSFWLIGVVVGGVNNLLTLDDGLTTVSYFLETIIGGVLGIIGQLASFLTSWLLLFLLYVLMPNTSVHLRPAAVGSMIAAGLWEIAKALFALYVTNAVDNSEGYIALYGTLALIPLFLFWVYVTWLIVLFGLELTYTLQTLKGRRLKEVESSRKTEHDLLIDPRWVIPVMTVVGDGFEQGKAVSVSDIHERTALPPRALTRLTDQLQREGLLHQLQDTSAGGECQFTLARPPELIPIQGLLDLGQTMANNLKPNRRLPAHDLLTRLTNAEHAAAERVTLANVLQTPSPAPDTANDSPPIQAGR
ncbi:MAG: YhjD/YihY/BrkB family envelope integrity protein [Phycisphaeraceae bacterium]